jgi:hypothetical protein
VGVLLAALPLLPRGPRIQRLYACRVAPLALEHRDVDCGAARSAARVGVPIGAGRVAAVSDAVCVPASLTEAVRRWGPSARLHERSEYNEPEEGGLGYHS